MKNRAAAMLAILFVVLSSFLTSCNGDIFGNNEPVDISLDKTLLEYDTITEVLGRNIQLTATATLKNGSTSTDIVWMDLPEDITSFRVISTSKGVLTFQILKAGTYVVTAGVKYNDEITKTAQCVITIRDALTGIEITRVGESAFESTTLNVGDVLDLAVAYTPTSTSQTAVQWYVNDMDILSVTEQPNGRAIITGRSAGTATVTARSTDNTRIYDTVTVLVQESGENQKFGIRSVEVSPSTGAVAVGKSLVLTAKVIDGNANEITSGDVAFTLEGSGATLSTSSRNAVLTALKGGEVTVHASFTYDGETVTADVPVTITGDIEAFTTSSSYINVEKGDTETVSVAYTPSDTERTGFNYTVDNNNIRITGQSSHSITFTAVEKGETVVTLSSKYDSSIRSTFTVNVVDTTTEADRIQKVTLSSNSLTFYPPFSAGELTAYVFRRTDDGNVDTDSSKTVVWSSSDETVIKVAASPDDPNTAILTMVKPGNAKVTATSSDNTNVSSSALVSVMGTLESLVPAVSSVNVAQNTKTSVELIPYPSYALYSAPIATLSNDGVSVEVVRNSQGTYSLEITGLRTGSTSVNVMIDGKRVATVNASVFLSETVSVRNIELSDTALALAQDADPYFLTAKAIDRYGNELDETVVVAPADSSSSLVASVERIGNGNDFYVIPKNAGSADFMFTVAGNTYAATRLHVEIGGSAVQGSAARQLLPETGAMSIPKGNTAQTRINVIPFGSNPGTITWTTADSSVASVTGNGLTATVWGIGSGTTTIRAVSDSGLSTSFSVTVTEDAGVTDTSIAYITLSSGSDSTHTITSTLRKSISIKATAHTVNGDVVPDTFTWSVEGNAVQSVQTNGATDTFSVITKQYEGMEKPAIVTVTSVSNPDVSAEFRIYVSANTTATDEAPQLILDRTGLTLAVGEEATVSYRILPVTYSGVFSATASSDSVSVSVDGTLKTVRVTADKAGRATVTLTDGHVSSKISVNVVAVAEKIDSAITGITLDRSYLSYDLAQKAPQTIGATVYRNGVASPNEEIVWSVENEGLVTLTVNGPKAAVAHKNTVGTTRITATAKDNPNVSASCYIEIIDSTQLAAVLRYIMVSETSVSMKVGESLRLTVTGQPSSAMSSAEFRWSSDDENVVTVSNGRITAVGEGVATITVTSGELSDSCRVYVSDETVLSVTPKNIVLSSALLSLSQEDMDKVFTVTANVISASGAYITDRNVIWSVNDPAGAIEYNTSYDSISVSPRNAGTATITASLDNVSATVKVIVGEAYVASDPLKTILLFPSPLTLEVGETATVTAGTVPSSSTDNLAWAITAPATVSMDTDGRTATLRGIKAGSSVITVYSLENPGISANMTVKVQDPGTITPETVTGVVLDKTSIVLDMNERSAAILKATVYKDGKPSDGQVLWTYTDGLQTATATYSAGNNIVGITKVAVGSGYITATSVEDSRYSATCYVEVIDSTLISDKTLISAMPSSTSVSLEKNDTYRLSVVTVPENLENVSVTYASTDETVASVTPDGIVTAVSKGKADINIIVLHESKILTLKCTVSVYENEEIQVLPSAIRFSENAVYLTQDDMDRTADVVATVYDMSFMEIEGATVYWEIADPSVASIVKNGNSINIAPLSAGKTTIKATYRNVTNTIMVIVGSPSSVLTDNVKGIVFDTSSAVMKTGSVKTVKASVVPAGAEGGISYTTNNDDVLSIESRNEDGSLTVRALAVGTAQITASSTADPSVRAVMNVTVQASTSETVTSIELDKHYIALTINDKALTELKATAYIDGKVARNVSLNWSLEGLTSAELGLTKSDSYGSTVYLTKKASGEGYVVVSTQDGSVSARCRVEITEVQKSADTVKYIRMSDNLLYLSQLDMDKVYTVTAGAYTASDKLVSESVIWEVDDPSGAIEWQNGANSISLSPRNAGTAVVTARTGNVSASVRIIVGAVSAEKSPVTALVIAPEKLVLMRGGEQILRAIPIPADPEDYDIVWSIDNDNIASITREQDGNVKVNGLIPGSATISATVFGTSITKSVPVTVKDIISPAEVTAVNLSRNTLSLTAGETGLLTAKVEKGGQTSEGAVVWDFSGIESFTVTSYSGNTASIRITGAGQGFVTVSSQENGEFKAVCHVIGLVSDPSLKSLSFGTSALVIRPEEEVELSVTTDPAGAADEIMWISDNTSVVTATPSLNGRSAVIRGIGSGSATVTAYAASDSRISKSVRITVSSSVSPATVTSVKVDRSSVKLSLTDANSVVVTASVEKGGAASAGSVTWDLGTTASFIDSEVSGNSISLTGKSQGSGFITATSTDNPGFSASVFVEVSSASTAIRAISLNRSSVTMAPTAHADVIATVLPSYAADELVWTSDNAAVATVEANGASGTITAVSDGNATITVCAASDASVKAVMTVSVKSAVSPAEVTYVSLTGNSLSVPVGDIRLLSAVVGKGGLASNGSVEWDVSGISGFAVATVSGNTVSIKAVSEGDGFITATSSDDASFSATCHIIGKGASTQLRSISFNSSSIILKLSESAEVGITTDPSGSSEEIGWATGNASVATVIPSEDGRSATITATGSGSTEITAYSKNDARISKTLRVSVSQAVTSATVTSIEVSRPSVSLSLADGNTVVLSAVVNKGNKASAGTVSWDTSGIDAIVDSEVSGNSIALTGAVSGSGFLTATSTDDPSVTISVYVEVMAASANIKSIALDKTSITVISGSTAEISATVLPSYASDGLVWTSGNEGVATVEGNGALAIVTGVSDGIAQITVHAASDASVRANLTVSVKSPAETEAVTAVVLDKTGISLDLADRDLTSVKATVYVNGKPSSRSVLWKADASLADVIGLNEIGFNIAGITLTGETGQGFIWATSEDDPSFKAGCLVQVIDSTTSPVVVLNSANISSKTITVGKGDTHQLTVQVLPADLEDWNVYWSSSDETVARVSDSGKVTAVSAGKAYITAQVVKDAKVIVQTCLVNVYANVSDAVTPSVITFTDNVLYLSQDNMDVATEVDAKVLDSAYNEMKYTVVDSWEIESGDNVVRMVTNGNTAAVYPLSAGTAEIRATYKNISNTFMVIVGEPTEVIGAQVRSIVPSNDSIILGIGASETVSFYAIPSGADDSMAFSATNLSVVSISQNGNTLTITGNAAGTARIKAISLSNPAVEKTIAVTVAAAIPESRVTSIVLDKQEISLTLGDKALTQLKATAYSNGVAVNVPIVWSMEGLTEDNLLLTAMDTNSSVISITKKSAGSGSLIASTEDGSVYSRCLVSIVNASEVVNKRTGIPARIIMSQDMVALSQEKMDEYTEVSAVAVDMTGLTVDADMAWTISDPSVARLLVAGNKARLYPRSGGTATLTATAPNGASNSALVIVGAAYLSDSDPKAVVLTTDKVAIRVGETVSVTGRIVPVSSSDSAIEWTGGSAQDAEITGVSGNTVTITGRVGGVQRYFNAKLADDPSVSTLLAVVVKNSVNDNDVMCVSTDKSSITLDVSEKTSTTIKVDCLLGSGLTNGAVSWVADASLDGVVSVSEIGNNEVSLVKEGVGSGYITFRAVSDPSFTATVYVEVIDSSVSDSSLRFINLSEHNIALGTGEKSVLTVSGYPVAKFAGKTVIWESSDTSVVAVSGGTVYAIGEGVATITAKVSGTDITDTCRVTVYSDGIGVLAIKIAESSLTLSVNEMYELNYDVIPMDAPAHLVWTSSDPSVAEVSRYGVITAKAAGSVVITVYDYVTGASSTVDVEVRSVEITGSISGITTNPSTLTARRGTSVRIRVYPIPAAFADTFSYAIDNDSVASIDYDNTDNSSVVIVAKSAGNATLTIMSESNPNITRTVQIKVLNDTTAAVTAVVPSRTAATMFRGGVLELTAKVYVDNKAVSGTKLDWTTEGFTGSAVSLVETDSLGSGVQVSALAAGSGYIVATVHDGSEFARIHLSITEQSQTPVETEGAATITLSDNVVYLSQNEGGAQVTAVIRGTRNSILVGPVTWNTTDANVFRVDAAGNTAVLTPVSAGNAKLTATYGGITAEAVVYVGSPAIAETDTSISSVSVIPSQLTLKSGATDSLYASVLPLGATGAVRWTTSNPTVLAVNATGRTATITALGAGNAVVTAYSDDNATIRGTASVTVKAVLAEDEVTAIKLNRSAVSMDLADNDNETALTATVYMGGKASNGTVTWAYDESLSGVISHKETGNTTSLVKLGVGSGYVTATSNDDNSFVAACYVEVTDSTVTVSPEEATLRNVILSSTSVTIAKGMTYTAVLNTVPEDIEGYSVLWTSGDETVATVDQTGKITGLMSGATYIKATVTKGRTTIERTMTVRVTEDGVALADLILSDTSLILRRNEAYTVRTTNVPAAAVSNLMWTSDDITVAKVSQNGTITAVSEGNTTIHVHDYGFNIHKQINVQVLATDAASVGASFIRLSVQTVELSQSGGTKDVTASVIATDGYPLAGATVTWTVDKEGVASMAVDGNKVTLSALDSGSTVLRAWYGTLSASAMIYTGYVPGTVPAALDHVSVNPSVLTIQTGDEQPLDVAAYPAGIDITPVWQSSDSTIASVDAEYARQMRAFVKGEKQGSTSITVKDSATEKSASARIRVLDDISTAVTSVKVDRNSITLDTVANTGVNLSATVYVAYTASSTESVEWKILNEDLSAETAGLVSVTKTDPNGRSVTVKPISVGSGWIKAVSASDPEVYALVYVSVIDSTAVPAEITELRLEFDSVTMTKGSTRRFNAVKTPANAVADIRWRTEDNTIATVDIYGNVTAVGAGSTTITAYVLDKATIYAQATINVIEKGTGGSSSPDTPSEFDIGSITITPPTATLDQEAVYPTAFTARIYDTSGKLVSNENVVWDTDSLNGTATVTKTEGNTIYLSAGDAGKGELIAKKTSRDGTEISKSAFIYTGAVEQYDPENPVLSAMTFNTSSPIYLVADEQTTRTVGLQYRPDIDQLRGAVWTYSTGASRYVEISDSDSGVTLTALRATPDEEPVVVTATSEAVDGSGSHLQAELEAFVVETAADLPAVTQLVISPSVIALNLADRTDVVVKATPYDWQGNVVETATVTWALSDIIYDAGQSGEGMSITAQSGLSIGFNKGTKTGTAKLTATCGAVKATASISITDSTAFIGISATADVIHMRLDPVTGDATTTVTIYGTPAGLFDGVDRTAVIGDTGSFILNTADYRTYTIRAIAEGSAILRFFKEVGGYTYTTDVTVYSNSSEVLGVYSISLSPAYRYMQVGDTVDLTAALTDRKGNTVNSSVLWFSSDPSVASVSGNLLNATVTAHSEGVAIINAKAGDVVSQTYINVSSQTGQGTTEPTDGKLVRILPGMTQANIARNDELVIEIATVPADAEDVISAVSGRVNVVRAYMNPDNNRQLILNGVSSGTATVTLSSGTVTTEIGVTVNGQSTPAYIRFNTTEQIRLSQEEGAHHELRALIYDANGGRLALTDDTRVEWEVGDSSVIRITDNEDNTVTIYPLNAGSTVLKARLGNITAEVNVAVNEIISAATHPTKITLSTSSLTLSMEDMNSRLVEVLYQPSGLSDEARSIVWSSTNTSVATVQANDPNGIGNTALVAPIAPGSAVITATSDAGSLGEETKASLAVTVLPVGAPAAKDTYEIVLDKTDIRMDFDTYTMISASLKRNGTVLDGSEAEAISWSFEMPDGELNVGYVVDNATASSTTGSTVGIHSGNRPGFIYAVAAYTSNGVVTTTRAQIEVADLSVAESTGLTSVVFSSSSMLMEVGDQATFATTVLPQITGVAYEWAQYEKGTTTPAEDPYVRFISVSNGALTIEALRTGTFDLWVRATLAGYEEYARTAYVRVTVVAEGAAEKTYSYSKTELSTTSLTLNQGADASYITATLVGTDGKKTDGAVNAWRLLDETGKEILSFTDYDWSNGEWEPVTEGSKYAISYKAGQAAESFASLIGKNPDVTDYAQDFSVIGTDRRMLRFVPGKAGLYFIEALGPDEGTETENMVVAARAIVYVTGTISGVTFSSNHLHMIKGETQMLTVSISPSTASVSSFEWSIPSGTPNVSLAEEGQTSVIVNAGVVDESSTGTILTYTATDVNGVGHTASVEIHVHDPSYGTGGIKQISFPSQFVTMGFPYTAQTYKASAYYMDGSMANDKAISYEIWYNGADVTESGRAGDVATFTRGSAGVTIVPASKGVLKIVAKLQKTEDDTSSSFSSEMYVTVGGNSNNLSLSSSSVVLYTGGSASVSISLDNPDYADQFIINLLSEYTADGFLIQDNKIKATGEAMDSVFKTLSTEGNVLTVGSKIVVLNKTIGAAYADLGGTGLTDLDFIGRTADDAELARILSTFPRTATFRIYTKDLQSYADLNVTVRLLPESNTYPMILSLSSPKVDLNPPFSAEQSITASLMDQNRKETSGTINWYFYPLGKAYTDKEGDEFKYNLPTTTDRAEDASGAISYYFSADGKTMYYVPQMAGLYRLTVTNTQNPQLVYTSTINITGDVQGISASSGSTLSVAKNNSTEISAVFTPANALARNVTFTYDRDGRTYPIQSDSYGANSFIQVRPVGNGNSATITGLQGTAGADTQVVRLIYPVETSDETNLELAWEGTGRYIASVGNPKNGITTYKVYESDGTEVASFQAYSTIVQVSVTVDKAIYSFSTTSSRSIDPSSLESGKVSFDMTATATSEGGSSVSPFSRWDWLEMRIVGNETGDVYASSVPVDSKGRSLYHVNADGTPSNGDTDLLKYYDEKEGQWESSSYSSANPSAFKYYNHNVYSFSLDSSQDGKDLVNRSLIIEGGEVYFVDNSYNKVKIVGIGTDATDLTGEDVIGELLSSEDGDDNAVCWFKTPGVSATEDVITSKRSVPLAIKASERSGKLDVDNGGSSWFFTLNTDAITNETLRIVVKVRDDVLHDPNALYDYGFDSEAVQINATNLALTIGGSIQNILPGTTKIDNNNGKGETTTVTTSSINVFEGTTVTFSPEFNPTNTHQKSLEWTVSDAGNTWFLYPGHSDTQDVVTITTSLTGQELMLTANAFGKVVDNDHRRVVITARSVENPSISCTWELDIQTLVKSLTFTATSQRQVNKNVASGVYSAPVYQSLPVEDSPQIKGASDIYCYDTTDTSGGGGNIDAFEIEYDPIPDYHLDFQIEVVRNTTADGRVIGTIETSDYKDQGVRKFRFVPTGRIYSTYDGNGLGSGDYTVAYGDVVARISNLEMGFSKEFTIHYMPATFRLVAYNEGIGEAFGSDGELDYTAYLNLESEKKTAIDENWDLVWGSISGTKLFTLKGMECVVLHKDDEINLCFAGTVAASKPEDALLRLYTSPDAGNINNGKATANPGTGTKEQNRLEVSWTVKTSRESDSNEPSDIVYATQDPYKNVVTITANKQGVAYLHYTISYPSCDENGNIIFIGTASATDQTVDYQPQMVSVSGSIPVYVISETDPELARLTQNFQTKATITALIPENISRAQREYWYGLSSVCEICDAQGQRIPNAFMYVGKTYAVFDGIQENVWVGSSIVYGTNFPDMDFTIDLSSKNRNVNNLLLDKDSSYFITQYCAAGASSPENSVYYIAGNPIYYYASDYPPEDGEEGVYLLAKPLASVGMGSLEDYGDNINSLKIDVSKLGTGELSEKNFYSQFADEGETYAGYNRLQDLLHGAVSENVADLSAVRVSIEIKGTESDRNLGFSGLEIKNGCSLTLTDVSFGSGTNAIASTT